MVEPERLYATSAQAMSACGQSVRRKTVTENVIEILGPTQGRAAR